MAQLNIDFTAVVPPGQPQLLPMDPKSPQSYPQGNLKLIPSNLKVTLNSSVKYYLCHTYGVESKSDEWINIFRNNWSFYPCDLTK